MTAVPTTNQGPDAEPLHLLGQVLAAVIEQVGPVQVTAKQALQARIGDIRTQVVDDPTDPFNPPVRFGFAEHLQTPGGPRFAEDLIARVLTGLPAAGPAEQARAVAAALGLPNSGDPR